MYAPTAYAQPSPGLRHMRVASADRGAFMARAAEPILRIALPFDPRKRR